MYPPELEFKDTTESRTSASYLHLLLLIGRGSQRHISLYGDSNFHFTIFPVIEGHRYQPIFANLWRFYLTTYPIRHGLLLLSPIRHPRFVTKIFLRENNENELRMQWELYKPTKDSVGKDPVRTGKVMRAPHLFCTYFKINVVQSGSY